MIPTRHEYWETQLKELERFIQWWFPHIEPVRDIHPDELKVLGLPTPLAHFYAFMNSHHPSFMSQNGFVQVEELRLNSSRCVFYLENQGVYEWSLDPAGEDPQVYGRFAETHSRWQPYAEPLSRFLCQACIFEAVIKAKTTATHWGITLTELQRVTAEWRKLPFGPWYWPDFPTEFYTVERALAVICPNGERFSIYCGSRESHGLDFMQRFYTPDWIVDGRNWIVDRR